MAYFYMCKRCWHIHSGRPKLLEPYKNSSGMVGVACNNCWEHLRDIALDDLSPEQRACVLCDCQDGPIDMNITFHDYKDDDDATKN